MKVMKTKLIKSTNKAAINIAVKILQKGGLVIYPTETSYGIAADATSLAALKKVKKIKKRQGKFIPIIISDMKMAKKYIVLNNRMKRLMKKFMPGPLTLVAEKKLKTKKLLGGFRIPENRFARELVKKFNKPITATSANISRTPPIYSFREIEKIFTGRIEMIINAGSLPQRKPSTVFDPKTKKVLRKGKISLKQIEKTIK